MPAPAPPRPVVIDWSAPGGTVANPLRPGARVLLVGAHPDDETIGAGRLAAGHDGPVRAVTLSAGESCLVAPGIDPMALAARRLGEWAAALAALGAEPVKTPRWPDSGLEAHEPAIAAMLGELVAGSDVVVVVWRHDPHPDHRAAGRAGAAAAYAGGVALVEYPVWAPYWVDGAAAPDALRHLCATATTAAAARARERALSAYSSQTEPLLPGEEPVVPAALLARHDRQLLVRADG